MAVHAPIFPDILYENERYKIDANYPAHILKVFTETNTEGGKSLLCYIELFSTFQYMSFE